MVKRSLKAVKPLVNGTPRRGFIDTSQIPAVGLTEKQRVFADHVWRGLTASAAYDRAFNTQAMPRQHVWIGAMQLVRKPEITLRFNQLEQAVREGIVSEHERRKALVLAGLERIASDDSQQTGPRVKALELLGKVRGTDLFSDRVEQVQGHLSPDQVAAQLQERLAKLGLSVADLVRNDAGKASQAKPMLALPAPSVTTQQATDEALPVTTSPITDDKA